MDLYVASQLPPRDQFKVSQRSKLQVALLEEPISPVVIVHEEETPSTLLQGDRRLGV